MLGFLLRLLLKDCPVQTDWLGVLLSVIFLLLIDALNGGVVLINNVFFCGCC